MTHDDDLPPTLRDHRRLATPAGEPWALHKHRVPSFAASAGRQERSQALRVLVGVHRACSSPLFAVDKQRRVPSSPKQHSRRRGTFWPSSPTRKRYFPPAETTSKAKGKSDGSGFERDREPQRRGRGSAAAGGTHGAAVLRRGVVPRLPGKDAEGYSRDCKDTTQRYGPTQ